MMDALRESYREEARELPAHMAPLSLTMYS